MADELSLAQLARLIEQYGTPQQQPDRADFLRSEKDTRPWADTQSMSDVVPYQDPGRWWRLNKFDEGAQRLNAQDIKPGAMWDKTKNALAQGVSDIGHGAAHLYQSGVDALTAPRRAYEGQLPQWQFDPITMERHPSEQGISEANNLVGWSMIGGSAATKPAAMAAREADSVAFQRAPEIIADSNKLAKMKRDVTIGESPSGRTLDPLGYYSRLDEVLGGFRPTDTVTAQTLAQRGVKASELQARGLDGLLERGGAKVQDLIAKASEPVRLNESVYGSPSHSTLNKFAEDQGYRNARDLEIDTGDIIQTIYNESGYNVTPASRWPSYSLDKGSNPTYRETVLSLPRTPIGPWQEKLTYKPYDGRGSLEAYDATNGQVGKIKIERDGSFYATKASGGYRKFDNLTDAKAYIEGVKDKTFEGGHWSEPNVIAHMRTSMQKDSAGRPVFHIDELQSDWGQNLRDGGVRDSPGHPLVNTSDQWQTTALRRALRQAVDANADAVAIPSGNTVHGYGMGTEGGAASQSGVQYAYDKMYPNVLAKELAKLDPTIKRQMEIIAGHESKGPFSYFPITDTARAKIKEGLPLFANASAPTGALASQSSQSDRDTIARILQRMGVQ